MQSLQQICHLDRSAAQWRDLRFPLRFSRILLNPSAVWLIEIQTDFFWGPYLSERQWGTVREDYSSNGDAWNYFPHDHARSRAYRWGEDGLAGISDQEQGLCFALALWNGNDPILKERLFGLINVEGNHGEDVKAGRRARSFLSQNAV